TGRWTCPECGHMYHEEFNPPVEDLVCDNDGAELYQREDDKPETVKNRISVYREQTQPLIDYYEKQGVLTEIDGDQEISEVTDELLSILS
ncbi:MAG: adenylate kinase, partial [Gammaproteobacteria bacterium]|nr:adenylate kinase [Phycisphaerae bacterium]NIP50746.1 adenylate kinase [Phycisphaerae bacterium]NIR92427.1 adenylate kinase [Gammaproteobacteria bacterium]NIW46325.1 adenylate kinase [Gammaproteobacteria bacterium]NIX26532.1 adenylate kinase [Phycisphaerae bacterium]